MPDPAPAVAQVQLELIGRIVNPQAFRARDTGKGRTPHTDGQVAAALEKAQAIQAAVALQLAMTGQAPDPPGRYALAASRSLLSAARIMADAARDQAEAECWAAAAACNHAETRLKALELVSAIRPTNWDDDEDPDQAAAWRAVDAALAGAQPPPAPPNEAAAIYQGTRDPKGWKD